MKILSKVLLSASILAISTVGVTAHAQNSDVQSASGFKSDAKTSSANSIDFASRSVRDGLKEEIWLDLGSSQTVSDIQIAWSEGADTAYPFDIAVRSETSGDWTIIFVGQNDGGANDFETYNVNDITAREIRIRGLQDDDSNIKAVKLNAPQQASPSFAPTFGRGGNGFNAPASAPSAPALVTVQASAVNTESSAPTPQPSSAVPATVSAPVTVISSNEIVNTSVNATADVAANVRSNYIDNANRDNASFDQLTALGNLPSRGENVNVNVAEQVAAAQAAAEQAAAAQAAAEAAAQAAAEQAAAEAAAQAAAEQAAAEAAVQAAAEAAAQAAVEQAAAEQAAAAQAAAQAAAEQAAAAQAAAEAAAQAAEQQAAAEQAAAAQAAAEQAAAAQAAADQAAAAQAAAAQAAADQAAAAQAAAEQAAAAQAAAEQAAAAQAAAEAAAQAAAEQAAADAAAQAAAEQAAAEAAEEAAAEQAAAQAAAEEEAAAQAAAEEAAAQAAAEEAAAAAAEEEAAQQATNNVFGLSPSLEPWENFDLDDWALDSPEGRSNNPCQSRRVNEDEWDEVPGTDTHNYIFTHTDGGMRFVSPVGGSTTSSSCNSGFPRSELREMLRRGNRSISTTGVNGNNWALGYQPEGSNHGGRNGELKATLRVNRVTTTGTSSLHPGRTIIGQIHADNDEPARLYYRKLPNADFGCIYLEHEIRDSDDVTFNMIGDERCSGNGPSNGIQLDELFSYEIRNLDEEIRVRVIRGDQDGEILSEVTVDMDALDSGYDRADEWMYFKAGAYTQNNTGDDDDTDVITFYRLSNTHGPN